MKRLSLIIFLFIISISILSCNTNKNKMDYSTVKNLDIERFMGKWYEIARFDHKFERGLVGVTATYQLLPTGKISVLNQGFEKSLNGKLSKAKGKAKQPNPKNPGNLKVSFFLFFYADYNVLELDKDYKWALIGSSSEDYLWILSRAPQLPADVISEIKKLAETRGYDTSKLLMVGQ